MDLSALAAEFPREAIHWRAQTVTKAGDKALALAYLDARDVMDRLDAVCGPENWQDEYVESVKGRVICRIGICIDGAWVWKSDGAGDTAVEGEKGGISDAFKRAAVKWGIGRYLYRLDSVWAPCEVGTNGKWQAWKGSPWHSVRGGNKPAPAQHMKPEPFDAPATRDRIKAAIGKAPNMEKLEGLMQHAATKDAIAKLPPPMQGELEKAFSDRMSQVFQAPPNEGEAA